MHERAPNRLLNLGDLHTRSFREVLQQLDALEAKDDISYLHPSKRWEYPWALERAQLAPGSRVLDAGCGASIFPIHLAACGHRVSAVDLHPPQGLAAMHGVRVDYRKAGIDRLPFPDWEFDAVFCISVIEHLGREGIPAVLQELGRVVRPGGRVVLTTDYYEDAAASLWYEGPGERFPVDWSFFDESLLRELILEAPGFRVDGEVDLAVDWSRTKAEMRRFHGYPYTSVGVALIRV